MWVRQIDYITGMVEKPALTLTLKLVYLFIYNQIVKKIKMYT